MSEIKAKKTWEPIDFTVYFSFIKWWLLLALILELAFRSWSRNFEAGIIFSQNELLAWIIRLIIFLLIGWRVIKVFGRSLPIAAIAGGCAGLVIGLVVAIFRLFDGFQLWKLFNLITETVLVAVVGALVPLLVVFIFHSKNKN
ncbi:MAG: hypothetical protein WC518_03235 [Patescibacteria group bacterium]